MQGYVIFPNLAVARPIRPDVDRFLATLPGKESNEAPVTESATQFEGIYTSALIDAFRKPEDDMVRTVDGINVVPNRMLKSVPKRAQAKAFRLIQKPESIIESDDKTYIGRIAPGTTTIHPTPPNTSDHSTLRDAANEALEKAGLYVLSSQSSKLWVDASSSPSANEEYSKARTLALPAQISASADIVEISGIKILGGGLDFVVSGPRMKVQRIGEFVGVNPSEKNAGSVTVGFAGGGGTVVPLLPNFVATVVVDHGRVVSLSYLPRGNPGDDEFLVFQGQIADQLRTKARITDDQVNAEYGANSKTRGPLNWDWVQAILRALDKYGPMSKSTVEIFKMRSIVLCQKNLRKSLQSLLVTRSVPWWHTTFCALIVERLRFRCSCR